MSILDIGAVIFGDIDAQIAWFQGKNLLAVQPSCSACRTPMVIQVRSDIQDKRRYMKSIYNQNGNAVTNNFIIGGDAQIAHAESQGVCEKGVFLRTQSSHSNNGWY